MEIVRLDPENGDLWWDYVAHLRRVGDAQWVLGEDGVPAGPYLFLGAIESDDVVGNLSLRVQTVTMPATDWTGGRETPLLDVGGAPLRETFVMTFHVEAPHRRRGFGRALQAAAMEWTREVGCLQMRSWSSLDKPANHALKISLGFAMDPAVHDAASGMKVSGVYFVKRVDTNP